MLSKRPIYNQQLKCVAYEILLPKDMPLNQEIVDTFLSIITISDNKLPIFVPIRLKLLIERLEKPIENKIVLLIDASEIDAKYSLAELSRYSFPLAVVFSDSEQLAFLNISCKK